MTDRTDAERLAWVHARCRPDADCMLWQLCVTQQGHPRASNLEGRSWQLRRYVWTALHGPVPAGKLVTVTCGCARCLNPEHLELTTKREVLKATLARVDVSLRKSAAVTRTRQAMGKLDMEKARYIRASEKTLQQVADELGISIGLASRVRRNLSWAEVNPFAGLGARA